MINSVKAAVGFQKSLINKMELAESYGFNLTGFEFVFYKHETEIDHDDDYSAFEDYDDGSPERTVGTFTDFKEKACYCTSLNSSVFRDKSIKLIRLLNEFLSFNNNFLKPLIENNLTFNDFQDVNFEKLTGYSPGAAASKFYDIACGYSRFDVEASFESTFGKAIDLGFTDENIKLILTQEKLASYWRKSLTLQLTERDLMHFSELTEVHERMINESLKVILPNKEMVLVSHLIRVPYGSFITKFYRLDESKNLFYMPKYLRLAACDDVSRTKFFVTPRVLTEQELETAAVLYSTSTHDVHSDLEQLYATVTTI